MKKVILIIAIAMSLYGESYKCSNILIENKSTGKMTSVDEPVVFTKQGKNMYMTTGNSVYLFKGSKATGDDNLVIYETTESALGIYDNFDSGVRLINKNYEFNITSCKKEEDKQ